MRGTKLEAWRIPPVWNLLQQENGFGIPENSTVPAKQKILVKSTVTVLQAIAADVRSGLLETVGVESEISTEDGRCSMILNLPPETDTELVARAIDLENIEAWSDSRGKVHVAVSPWFSTKDVDQTVLCTIKVIHVLLGLHATDEAKPKTFRQKIMSSVMEVMNAQKTARKRQD